MNHFDYRNGVLHAEAVNLIDLAEAVGTPFYCYSTATLERHYRVFTDAFAGEKARGLLRHEGELQPVGAAHAGEARRRRRRGLGRRIEARARGRHSAAEDPVLRRRQDRSRTARGACGRHPLHQRRIRAGARIAVAARRGDRQDGADLGARQPRRRCRHPRQDLHRQVREQVRHSDRARARRLCPRGQAARASRSPAPTCISAARSPISAGWKPRSASWSEFVQTLRADGHNISHIDFGGGLGIPYYMDREAPPAPTPMPRWSSASRTISAAR